MNKQQPNIEEETLISYQDLEENEEDSPLNDTRLMVIRRLAAAGAVVFMIMFSVAAFVEIPIEELFEFTLKSNKKEQIYRFPSLVYVNDLYVHSGIKIKKNDPLAKIGSPQIAHLIAEYNQAKRKLDAFYAHDTILYHSQRRNLQLLLSENENLIKKINGEENQKKKVIVHDLKRSESTLKDADHRYQTGLSLYQSKTISDYELRELEQKKIQAQSALGMAQGNYTIELESFKHSLENFQIKERQLLEQLANIDLLEQKQTAELQNNLQNAYEKIQLNYGNHRIEEENLVLLAGSDGEVTYVLETEKEVHEQEILIRVLQNPSSMYAYAYVPPQRVSYINAEQKAILKVKTFPHYEWGVMEGKVKRVSVSPDANGMYPFEVEITDSKKIGNLLQIGMNGSLSVVVEEKTIFGIIFQKFNVWKDNQMGLRSK